jgi:hypothetical protein
MEFVDLTPGPIQLPITRERLADMLNWKPRRSQLSQEWTAPVHGPASPEKDWSVVLPFPETLKNAFELMCDVPTIGMRKGRGGRCYTFLTDAKHNPASLERVREWHGIVGKYVAIRDCLALSFALDYDRQGGNPSNPQTAIGALRSRAKPYDAAPTADTFSAADELAAKCVECLTALTCYSTTDVVVGMPPSRPGKAFDLPSRVASRVAQALRKPDLTANIRTLRERPSIKNTPLAGKLSALDGTVEVDQGVFRGKGVLVVDDLYQSGISMSFLGMLLLEAGAKRDYGLACEKTCRNDDNTAR